MKVSTETRRLRHLLLVALGQEELGLRVKQAREEAGLTQPELAGRIGLKHPQSVSNYERGVSEIPTAKLRRIAEVTGKDLGFFLGEATAEDGRAAAEASFVVELRVVDARLRRIEQALGIAPPGEDASLGREAANGN